MAYGVNFRYQYSRSGNTYKVDVELEGYEDSIIPIERASLVPVTILQREMGREEEALIINGSSLEFNFYSRYEDSGQFDPIFTSEYKDYRISYYRDGTLIWRGYVEPENLTRDFVLDFYELKMTAIDGLAELKNNPFRDVSTNDLFIDRVTGITIVKRCLEHIGIDLDIKVQVNIIVNTLMTTSECVLNKVNYDCSRFIQNNEGRQEVKNCYTVLEEILKIYSVELSQIEGNWWIISKHEINSPLYSYNWTTLAETRTSLNNLELDISDYNFRNTGDESIIRPIKTHEITFKNYNLGDNSIANGDFSDGTNDWTSNDFASFTVSSKVAFLTSSKNPALDGGSNLYLQSDNFPLSPTGEDQLVITFSIKLQTLVPDDQDYAPILSMLLLKGGVSIPVTEGSSIILQKDGEWSTHSRTYPINTVGNDYAVRITIGEPSSVWDIAVINLKEITSNILFADGSNLTFDKIYATSNTDTVEEKITKDEIIFGDSTFDNDAGDTKIGEIGTYSWKRYGETESLLIANLMGINKVTDYSDYKEYLKLVLSDVDDTIKPYHKIKIDTKTYRIKSYSKSHIDWKMELTLEEIILIDPTLNLNIYPLTSQDGVSPSEKTGSANSSFIEWSAVLNTPTTLAGYGLSSDAYTQTYIDSNFSASGHDHTFASLTNKPTTIAGYGITNAYTKTEIDATFASHTHTFASLTSKPTTIAGYGITDAYTKTYMDANFQALDSTLTRDNVAEVITASWTFHRADENLVIKATATNDSAVCRIRFRDSAGTSLGYVGYISNGNGHLSLINQRTGGSLLLGAGNSTDLTILASGAATFVSSCAATIFTEGGTSLVSKYANISHTHTFASLTSKPTTISGYGITNAYTKTESDANYQSKSNFYTESNVAEVITSSWAFHRAGDNLVIKATATANSAIAYIRYRDSAGTSLGQFGFLSAANGHWTLTNHRAGGSLLFGTNSTTRLTITSAGHATFTETVTASNFNEASDRELKKSVDPICECYLGRFDKIKPIQYLLKKGNNSFQFGVIAQDIEKIYPNVVSNNENGHKAVNYRSLSMLTLAKVQVQQKEIEGLKTLVNGLIEKIK